MALNGEGKKNNKKEKEIEEEFEKRNKLIVSIEW
jgi:hypothetical protein